MSSQHCPECSRQLKPNARFCSYCGVSLQTQQDSAVSVQTHPAVSTSPSQKEVAEEVTTIPAVIESALIMRGKLETLQTQKIALDEELETVKVKQLVGELSESKAKKQFSQLNTRLGPITKEIEELENKALTPLEQLQQGKKVQEGRLHRLDELRNSGEVDDAIYQRLSSEYKNKLNELNQQLETETSQANRWLSQLEDRKQQLEFERETLQIRARIDEVSKRDVKKQLKLIDEELNKLTSVITGLRSLLGQVALAPKERVLKQPLEAKAKNAPKKPALKNCPYCKAQITSPSKYCYTCGRLLQS